MDQSPLHVAVTQRDVDMVHLLLEHGARDDLKSEYLRRDLENLLKHKVRLFPDVRRPIVGAEIIPNGDVSI
jgi:ankyrin repeat protein